jgi:site-specific recombinase XerD
MANLHLKKKDNPKLKYKKLSDGRLSLYLEYYFGYEKEYDPETEKFKIKHKRSKEFLELYIEEKPSTPVKRKENNETLEIAHKVRQLKEDELKSKKLNIPNRNKGKINFLDFCNTFLANYPNKDIRIVRYCIKYLGEFVEQTKGMKYILPADVTSNFAIKFKNYLEKHLNGETPHNYFTKFKKMCRQAIKEGYPVDEDILEIKNKRNEGLKKAILSIDEIQALANAECGNTEVKRAFLFCLNTGLRFCDVNVLKWHEVNEKHIIIKAQQKTGVSVYIDLNENAKLLLGKKGAFNESVFTLPSLSSCLRTLKIWSKRAGIEKNITWHSSRHSFAVNLLSCNTDIKTVSGLLGHAGLKHTEKYTRVVDKLKKEAVNRLPTINMA